MFELEKSYPLSFNAGCPMVMTFTAACFKGFMEKKPRGHNEKKKKFKRGIGSSPVCLRVAEVAYREALYIGTNAITPKLVIGHTLKDDDEVADRA